MPARKQKSIQYWRRQARAWQRMEAQVIVEQSVSITINGVAWLSLRCTPSDLEALAVGFLFNEGLIASLDEVADVRPCAHGDNVDVWLNREIEPPERWQRTSGCAGGVTSHSTETDLASPAPRLYNSALIHPSQISRLISLLFDSQDLYRSSGGVHTSALSDGEAIRVSAEDIGRHNTLDKIAGRMLLDGLDFSPRFLLTTGRISSEMLQKSARLGAAVVISRTSPSSLSIELAERWGITLIGYARRDRFNLYTHPQRLWAPETDQNQILLNNPSNHQHKAL